jgi:hypothetical protein
MLACRVLAFPRLQALASENATPAASTTTVRPLRWPGACARDGSARSPAERLLLAHEAGAASALLGRSAIRIRIALGAAVVSITAQQWLGAVTIGATSSFDVDQATLLVDLRGMAIVKPHHAIGCRLGKAEHLTIRPRCLAERLAAELAEMIANRSAVDSIALRLRAAANHHQQRHQRHHRDPRGRLHRTIEADSIVGYKRL